MKRIIIGFVVVALFVLMILPSKVCHCKNICSCTSDHCTCNQLLDVPKAPRKTPKTAKPTPQEPPVKNTYPPGKDPNPSNPGPGTDPFIPGQCPSCP
jgi:hypothetical protein